MLWFPKQSGCRISGISCGRWNMCKPFHTYLAVLSQFNVSVCIMSSAPAEHQEDRRVNVHRISACPWQVRAECLFEASTLEPQMSS